MHGSLFLPSRTLKLLLLACKTLSKNAGHELYRAERALIKWLFYTGGCPIGLSLKTVGKTAKTHEARNWSYKLRATVLSNYVQGIRSNELQITGSTNYVQLYSRIACKRCVTMNYKLQAIKHSNLELLNKICTLIMHRIGGL